MKKEELNENSDKLAKDVKAMYESKMKAVNGKEAKTEKAKKLKGSDKRKAKAEEKRKLMRYRKALKNYFVWGGMKLVKAKEGLVVLDESLNVYCAKGIEDKLNVEDLDRAVLKTNYENGDFILVLERCDDSSYKFAALTVTTKDVLRAREQRLVLAHTGGLEIVASLIERDLNIKREETVSLQDFIEAEKENFLSFFSLEVVKHDIERILKNY